MWQSVSVTILFPHLANDCVHCLSDAEMQLEDLQLNNQASLTRNVFSLTLLDVCCYIFRASTYGKVFLVNTDCTVALMHCSRFWARRFLVIPLTDKVHGTEKPLVFYSTSNHDHVDEQNRHEVLLTIPWCWGTKKNLHKLRGMDSHIDSLTASFICSCLSSPESLSWCSSSPASAATTHSTSLKPLAPSSLENKRFAVASRVSKLAHAFTALELSSAGTGPDLLSRCHTGFLPAGSSSTLTELASGLARLEAILSSKVPQKANVPTPSSVLVWLPHLCGTSLIQIIFFAPFDVAMPSKYLF